MDAVLDQIRDIAEGQIDFTGQRLTDSLSTILLITFSILGLGLGFVQGDIHLSMWVVLASVFVTMLIVVPPWPVFNRNPQPWIGSRGNMKLPHGGIVVSGMKTS